jgi:dual specificity phosphatase 12
MTLLDSPTAPTLARARHGYEKTTDLLLSSAMGKSRSATCCVAYLMKAYNISPMEALERIRQARPIVEPNDGFMQQLDMYHRMKMMDDVENSPIYQRWMYYREVQLTSECGQAPDTDNIRFEDEHVDDRSSDTVNTEYKCRKCRYV